MAVRNQEMDPKKSAEEKKSIEQLAKEHKIPEEALAGMMAANGWKPGKQMLDKEFQKAFTGFQKAPIHGGK